MQLPPTLVDYLIVFVLCVVIFNSVYTRWLKISPHFPPGPQRLPLIGNIHQIPFEYQQRMFASWAKHHGDIIYMQLFHKPSIIVDSVRVAQELMEKRASKYSDRPQFVMVKEYLQPKPSLVFMSWGEKCRRLRKFFQSALENKAALEGYRPLQRREIHRLLRDLAQSPMGFMAHVKRYAGAIILEIDYGHRVTSAQDEWMVYVDHTVDEFTTTGSLAASLVDFLPLMKHIPSWMPGGGFKKRALIVGAKVRDMMEIPYRKVQRDMASGCAKPSFMTSLLEKMTQDGCLSAEEEYDIKASCLVMYTAGSDTTITSLMTFILAMVLHPHVLDKAQAEIDRVIGSERLPELDDREALPYVDCIVKEVYRWNPPSAIGIPHRVMEDDIYRGYVIPGGATIIPNIWSMGHHTDIYSDPEKFFPERFEEMDTQTANQKDPRKFIFGFGKRICPGRYLADETVWLAIANILATMNIQKCRDPSGQEITPIPSFKTGIVSQVDPFLCEIKPRTEKAANLVGQHNAGDV
ncbi:hypothetical protein POSPLADRAFT_1153045 [Postia placenta MAD-698-R-SB12]|uniref:Cytochrome P450 n=1 Tax=Postia placenta MAD-698-R-SB12 TaxID=670580 RepID=A0A1X6MQJ9_9APHY|nr:hypothetical protein POSPLADRAFT_1153045 [Postia placenta MAD-698-R-SB12]OSX58667.1 hypothetical protein POSPLADRAFT_1153045 [Postia placenta MAD-698-R-SB12]